MGGTWSERGRDKREGGEERERGRESIYYKELTVMIMEAKKSQYLQSASWRPKGPDGTTPG